MTPQQLQADQLGEIRNLWLSLMPHQKSALVQVCRHLGELGPNACGVLETVAGRLRAGAAQYGQDFTDGRHWTAEALAEQLDAIVYIALALKAAGAKPSGSNGHARKLDKAERSSPKAAE